MNLFSKNLNKFITHHDIISSLTLEDEVNLLDPFTHSKQDSEKILSFDFIRENSTTKREKVMIDQTFCTLVTVGGKYLEKRAFKKIMQKIDEIRRMIRIKNLNIIFTNKHEIQSFLSMIKDRF